MAEMFASLRIYGTFRPEDGVYVIIIPGAIGIAAIEAISSFIYMPRGLQLLLFPLFPLGASIYLFICHKITSEKRNRDNKCRDGSDR